MTIVDPHKGSMDKLSKDRAKKGYFCAFGNNLRFYLYWDPQSPKTLKRSYHAIVEDTATFAILEKKIFSFTDADDDKQPEVPEDVKTKIITEGIFSSCATPFPDREVRSITITLPSYPQPLGLRLADDLVYNLPYIFDTTRNSFAYHHIPVPMKSNHFIIAINSDSPITKNFAINKLLEIQQSNDRTCTLDLVHRGSADKSTSLFVSRTIFDNFPSYLLQKPIICNMEVPATHRHFVVSPVKPDKPKSIFECLKSQFKSHWKAAAWIQFKKNQKIACFSLPFPKPELPSGARVFRTLLVPEWKSTEVPTIWEPRIRECIIGTPQQKSIDFDQSYAATVDPATVKCHISYAAAKNQLLVIIDIKNAFQNTFAKPEHRIYVTTPPTYLEWLSKEEGFKYSRNEVYYRMMYNANQGTKDAANQWNSLLDSVFTEYGMHKSIVDHGFYTKSLDDNQKLLVSLATDDLLVSVPKYTYAEDLIQFLKQYFSLTVQRGPILKFLGIRIVQTDIAISLDQSEYIFELLRKHFGTTVDHIKTVSTPMRYDNTMEREIFEAIELDDKELLSYALEYNGSYRYHTGSLGFASNLTRWDIKFAVQRLAEFNNAPTAIAFKSTGRIYKYLAGDPLRPLVFPRASFSKDSTLSYLITPGQEIEFIIPNMPTNFNDAELGRCLKSRKSYYCTMILVLGVIVQMKVRKTESPMTHTTDSEMRASFDGCRHLIPIRLLFQEMGLDMSNPSILFSDNKAVTDIIDSGRMTPRCRHIAIPIAFLHANKGQVFHEKLITTDRMIADIGTKPVTPALHKRFKYWGMGERFLPSRNHIHYSYLQMHMYETKYCAILKMMSNDSCQSITMHDAKTSQDGGGSCGSKEAPHDKTK